MAIQYTSTYRPNSQYSQSDWDKFQQEIAAAKAGSNPSSVTAGYGVNPNNQYNNGQAKYTPTGTDAYGNTTWTNNNNLPYQNNTIDYASLLQKQYGDRMTSQLAQIKAAYDKSRSSINAAIPGVGQAASKLRKENDAMYYTQQIPELRAALEQAGLYKGGAMPEGMVKLGAARMGNIGSINQEEANQLAEMQKALADIDAQEQQANISAQSGLDAELADKLFQANQWEQQFGLQKDAFDLQKIAQAYEQTKDVKNEYANTIGRFGQDYQAEINKVQNDNDASNDWQIPLLQAKRQEKIAAQAAAQVAAEEKAAAAKTAAEKTAYERAMALWKQNGVATAEIAQILGVPVNARTADYDIAKINAATAQKNANTAALNAGKEKSTDSLYNSTYAKAVGWKNSYMPELEVVAGIMATKGLTNSQKQEILDSLYPDPEK